MIGICGAILATFFGLDGLNFWPDALVTSVPIVITLLAVVVDLATVGSRITVEKDWIVVISDQDNGQLSKINSTFRMIDLLCLLVASATFGSIFDFLGTLWAAVFVAACNLVSVLFEYQLLISIYNEYPGYNSIVHSSFFSKITQDNYFCYIVSPWANTNKIVITK